MDIYDEVFNELIRQITINCPERGILLMKVRDEMKVTVAAHKALYESSVIFGMRKQVQAEEGVEEMEQQIKELERKKTILQNQLFELNNEAESIEKGFEEINKYQIEENRKEIKFLEDQKLILEEFNTEAVNLSDPYTFKGFWADRNK
jgi:dynein light intermediate chain